MIGSDEPGSDEEPRYTLEEAAAELARRECQTEGHRPVTQTITLSDPVGVYYCACGQVLWTPYDSTPL